MLDRLASFGKRLLGRSKAGRDVSVLPNDTFIVSYPRSGNTWPRFLVGNLICARQGPTDFLNIEERIPDIHQNSDAALGKLKGPRMLKSHELFDPRYNKVLYIVRNPVDVVVSYCYYMIQVRNIDDDYPIAAFARRFLDGGLDRFGTWREHVGGWRAARMGSPDFAVMRYEDQRLDTVGKLGEIAAFLGVEASPEDLSGAVACSSAERMRELEETQAAQSRPLKRARTDIRFVRSAGGDAGRSGGLAPDLVDMISGQWHETMDELGYL